MAQRLRYFAASAVAVAIALAAFAAGRNLARPAPDRAPPAVAAAEAAGRSYAPAVLASYASAWSGAADRLAAGATVPDALASVRPAWEAARVPIFERDVGPVFAAIVPPATPETAIKPEDRKALAEAFRAFARGLSP